MGDIVEIPRARFLRLKKNKSTVILAVSSIAGLVDLLIAKGIITNDEFYESASAHLEE